MKLDSDCTCEKDGKLDFLLGIFVVALMVSLPIITMINIIRSGYV